jgi:inosine/xanthosine triphosphate pyrophosphatase family protein
MYILTSSTHKINEYKEFGLEAKQGPDILEVQGTIDEVITYKILAAGSFILVEDTVLEIGGHAVVDSKYKLKQIPVNNDAAWITSLGYHDNINLYVFRGVVKGCFVTPVTDHESSFEPCFIPTGAEMTLFELKQKGLKQHFSARRLALEAYRGNQPQFIKQIMHIPAWKGAYQVSNFK